MPAYLTRLALLLVLTTASTGCAQIHEPSPSVSAMAVPRGIQITNSTDFTACYGVMEVGRLAVSLMAPLTCVDPDPNWSVPPHAQVLRLWSEVSGFDPARTDYSFWWMLSGNPETGSSVVSSAGVTLEP